MSYRTELRIYLISLKCIGLLCLTNDTNETCYISDADDIQALIGFIVAQIVSWTALLYFLLSPDHGAITDDSVVGNTYLLIDYCSACLTISMVYLMFYVKRRSLIALLGLLLESNRKDLRDCYAKQFFTRFLIHVCMSSVCGVIFGQSVNYNISLVSNILLCFIFTYSYMLIGLIIVLYSCLTQVLAALLHLHNRDLLAATEATLTATTTKTTTMWRRILWHRNQMLIICHEQLNSDFGLVMVLITAFVIISAPAAPFYLITIIFVPDASQLDTYTLIRVLILTITWNIPWLAVMVMIFRKDVVSTEVCINTILTRFTNFYDRIQARRGLLGRPCAKLFGDLYGLALKFSVFLVNETFYKMKKLIYYILLILSNFNT